ncbi:hypothetical protein CAEBREN_24441 [Caenorhabditis brenneri]|uniref:F-box domain-containing protein n=1 Tax=Caenorhabditis brenneri TaxID=135651 RepID=G0NVN6_CAEBE|nr:hypothetical protein CAEBREN_24441 [Caenorhabditis brenneri]
MTNTTPAKRKFPILELPFLARKNVLLRLQLDDLIPISFLSKRSKLMIRQVLPFKKAQYNCTVWYKEVTIINIRSRFGFYTSYQPNVDHILEVLSYPSIHVFFYGEHAITSKFQWVKTNRNCIRRISFLSHLMDRKMILDLVNHFIELNVRIDFGKFMVFTCSPEELRVKYLNSFLIIPFWSLKCQKLQIVDSISPIVMTHRLISSWTLSNMSASSTIKQLIFVLKNSEEIEEWLLIDGWKRIQEEWQHPIYGKIKEWYKHKDIDNRKEAIMFEAHHHGKRLLVMNIENVVGHLDRH